jgi:hypothetical protein
MIRMSRNWRYGNIKIPEQGVLRLLMDAKCWRFWNEQEA